MVRHKTCPCTSGTSFWLNVLGFVKEVKCSRTQKRHAPRWNEAQLQIMWKWQRWTCAVLACLSIFSFCVLSGKQVPVPQLQPELLQFLSKSFSIMCMSWNERWLCHHFNTMLALIGKRNAMLDVAANVVRLAIAYSGIVSELYRGRLASTIW